MSSLTSPRTTLLLALAVCVQPSFIVIRGGDIETDGTWLEAATGASTHSPQSKPTPKQAIRDGLLWLARHQSTDGSWGAKSARERCTSGKPCGVVFDKHAFTDNYDEGLTGLAVLCFLRAGYGPEGKQDLFDPISQHRYKVGEVVSAGLAWLKKIQNAAGSFQTNQPFMYNQDTATLAMIEAAETSKDAQWKDCAQRAVDMIQKAQRPSPSGSGLWGWRYGPRGDIEAQVGNPPKTDKGKTELYDSDTSVTAWSAAALSAAHDLGLEVKKESFDGAIAFCDYVSLTDGRVGYQNSEGAGLAVTGVNDQFNYHAAVMSALGMVIRLYANHDRKHPFFELAAQRVLQDLPAITSDKLSIDYYYWYEASLALNHFDGESSGARPKKKYSGPWNKAATQALLELQDHTKASCSNGGWVIPDRWSYTGGPVYCTEMAVLALEACNPK